MERETQITEKYPYVQPKTFEFLQVAIAEGAHLKLPEAFAGYSRAVIKMLRTKGVVGIANKRLTAEDLWVRMRNIAGTYFSSWAIIEDIGRNYESLSRERVSYLIEKFIACLWENCSPEAQAAFPLRELDWHKPVISRAAKVAERHRHKIIQLAQSGRSYHEIALEGEVRPEQVRRLLLEEAEHGRILLSLIDRNRYLEKRLAFLPDDSGERQRLLDQVEIFFYTTRPDQFVTLRTCFLEAGRRLGRGGSLEAASQVLARNRVPFRVIVRKINDSKRGSFESRYHILFRRDKDWAVQVLRASPEIDWVNPLYQQLQAARDLDERRRYLEQVPHAFLRKYPELFLSLSGLLTKNSVIVPKRYFNLIVRALRKRIPLKQIGPRITTRPGGITITSSVYFMLKSDGESFSRQDLEMILQEARVKYRIVAA